MKSKTIITLIALTALVFPGFGTSFVKAAEPEFSIYVVPPISDAKILPTTAISSTYLSNEISVSGCPSEFIPASFVIRATEGDIVDMTPTPTDLMGPSGSYIDSSNVDIRVVKCWYQHGERYNEPAYDPDAKVLIPELLLKDDSLVNVVGGENYLKVSGEYVWISSPNGIPGVGSRPYTDEWPVQDSPTLLPVDIPNGTNKQFWITIEVPTGTAPGNYSGQIRLNTPGGIADQVQLYLEVLPIELAQPNVTHSLYYTGRWNSGVSQGSISESYKSEQQLAAELENLVNHGVNPAIYASFNDKSSLHKMLSMMSEAGINNQPLYYLGLTPWGYQSISAVREMLAIAESYGIPEVYFYGVDEALGLKGGTEEEAIARLVDQRSNWEAIRAEGGKIFVAGVREGHYSGARYPGNFGFMGDIQDLLVCAYSPRSEEAARWHSEGHKIFSYGNPQAGEEKPEKYRRNYGLLLWQEDYDGAMPFAYQHSFGTNIWNDFDATHTHYKMEVFAYPTVYGVIDTIGWEGWREGVDDIRYMTTLLEVIEEAKTSGIDTISAEAWLADLKISNLGSMDLDVVRSQMVDHILALSTNTPTTEIVLRSIGDKTVVVGEILEFTINSTDPTNNELYYSAANLPPGATFNTQTRTFSWTPNEVGTYNNVYFEVSDGEIGNVFSYEEITITVYSANQPPVLNSVGNKNVGVGEVLEFTVSATDPEGNELAYSTANLPPGATFNTQTRTFSWTPIVAGTYGNIYFEVSDGELIDFESITITVTAINQPPVLNSIGNKNVGVGEVLEFTVSATDPEGNELAYSTANLPPGATFNTQTRTFSWTPIVAGTYGNIYFEVSDGELIDFESIMITVTASTSPSGGGGGGFAIPFLMSPTSSATNVPGHTYISSDNVDENNRIISPVTATSEDNVCQLVIDTGTICLTSEGEVLDEIKIYKTEDQSLIQEDYYVIGSVYDFGPDGATFEPDITLVFNYDDSVMDDRTEGSELVIGCSSSLGEKYTILDNCVVDPIANTITVSVSHFSTFAVLYQPQDLPAMITFDNLNISPGEVVVGEEVVADITISNTGGQICNTEVVLTINGQLQSIEEVSVEVGGTEKVSFKIIENIPGIYLVNICGNTQSFVVQEVPSTKIIQPGRYMDNPDMNSPSPIDTYNWSTLAILIGVAVNFMMATAVTILLCRRRLLRNYLKKQFNS